MFNYVYYDYVDFRWKNQSVEESGLIFCDCVGKKHDLSVNIRN